ncbi:MAG: hypothetical protein M3295_03725 [Chloroflexota bacterium]|nr:hypothetical protein [Chloroflexota bacterium]
MATNDLYRNVIQLLRENEVRDADEVAGALDVDRAEVEAEVIKLVSQGVVERRGTGLAHESWRG